MSDNMVLILDFGGSQSQAIARKVRSESVYCEILAYDTPAGEIAAKSPRGIILAGGARDVTAETKNGSAPFVYSMGVPVLAMGGPAVIMARDMGASLGSAVIERRTSEVCFGDSPLFDGLDRAERYFSRADAMELPQGFDTIAAGEVPVAFADENRKLYGIQFLPETNDPEGITIVHNFLFGICGCEADWSMEAFVEREVARIRGIVGEGRALLAISGGVDSTVCAALMHRAIGRQLVCIHVDNGFMRKGETALVAKMFREQLDMDLICVDAGDRFLAKLSGVTDPEEKRSIIGEEFIRVFEEEAAKLGQIDYLVQGTIYPDVIESFGVDNAHVKTHHNVGGLPQRIGFKSIIEPVRELFKDEVRSVGYVLGLPAEFINRQPFPGPGLAVRMLGEVTRAKLDILREADAIFREEILSAGLDKRIWQYFAVMTDFRSTGVTDGKRSYEYTIALRAVNSVDAMNATVYRLPYDLLERVVTRITAEVPGVNRVVYDITPKPPATLEWE